MKTKKEFECQVSNYKILSLGFQLGEREMFVHAYSRPLLGNIMQLCCTGLECVLSLSDEQETCQLIKEILPATDSVNSVSRI